MYRVSVNQQVSFSLVEHTTSVNRQIAIDFFLSLNITSQNIYGMSESTGKFFFLWLNMVYTGYR